MDVECPNQPCITAGFPLALTGPEKYLPADNSRCTTARFLSQQHAPYRSNFELGKDPTFFNQKYFGSFPNASLKVSFEKKWRVNCLICLFLWSEFKDETWKCLFIYSKAILWQNKLYLTSRHTLRVTALKQKHIWYLCNAANPIWLFI